MSETLASSRAAFHPAARKIHPAVLYVQVVTLSGLWDSPARGNDVSQRPSTILSVTGASDPIVLSALDVIGAVAPDGTASARTVKAFFAVLPGHLRKCQQIATPSAHRPGPTGRHCRDRVYRTEPAQAFRDSEEVAEPVTLGAGRGIPGQSQSPEERYMESAIRVAASRPEALAMVLRTENPPSPSSEDSA